MSEELEQMSLEQLKALLKKTEDLLEEVEEERKWMLTGTCKHVPGSTAKKYDGEINNLGKKIEKIKILIQEAGTDN